MTRIFRAALAGVALAAGAASAQSLLSAVSPALPTTADTVWVTFTGTVGGADTIADSGVTIAGDTVRAHVSIRPCQGVCPRNIKAVSMRLRVGKLAAGSYLLVSTVNQIDRGQAPPDTLASTRDWRFTVYPATSSPHRLAGTYWSHHTVSSPDTASYFFTNGDTLSVTAVVAGECCGRYAAAIHSTGDGDNDTLTVLFSDTTVYLCDCLAPTATYLTAAVENVSSSRLWVRVLYAGALSSGPDLVYAFSADQSTPALCINSTDVNSPGIRLFVDSSWFAYELPTPVVRRAAVLRFQPNPGFDARTDNSLFIDNVGIDTMNAGGDWSGTVTALETFETYYEGQWQTMAHRDGSALSQYWLLATGGHLTELKYSNSISGSVSNYLWRALNPTRTISGTSRIILTASCRKPEGATAAASVPLVSPAPEGARITARGGGPLVSTGAPAVVEVVDMGGRTIAVTSVEGPVAALPRLRQGVYLLRVRAGGTVVRATRVVVDR